MSEPLAFRVPDDLVEAIAHRAAELVLEQQRTEPPSRWLYGARAAAGYLGWPVKRVNNMVSVGKLPHHATSELDQAVRDGV